MATKQNVYFKTDLQINANHTWNMENILTWTINNNHQWWLNIKIWNYINDEQYIYDYMLWSLSFISLFVLVYGLLSIFKIKKND
jgi:hypothetical protein